VKETNVDEFWNISIREITKRIKGREINAKFSKYFSKDNNGNGESCKKTWSERSHSGGEYG
jgi:hypothetical protein